jgi:hypothetical protein
MIYGFWISVFKEFVTIRPDVCIENPNYDLVAKLALGAYFTLNLNYSNI